ncbi:unnamed protein product, partial [Onchocerca ochengi]|uniref:EGF-like domain-containing protein n=1 Tax=Onchocerca ochengi TaxID=42157 RepID=A0A182EDM7_ONCOC
DKVKQQWNSVNGTITNITTITTTTASTTSSSIKFFEQLSLHSSNDDVNVFCRNGGTMIGNSCICLHPYTGSRCLDFACVHGISVGIRYDPDSLFFNKPCICDEDWTVEVIIQCNDHGEFRNGQCHCAEHFFGSQCQYVSRCDNGKRKHGRCLCDKGWKGDYCHDIICQHGYPDVNNKSKSCVCPARFTGAHCDRCSQKGPKIRPYPECNIDVSKSKAKLQRQEAETQRENLRRREYEIRKTILEKAARSTECLNAEGRTEEDRNRMDENMKTNRRLSNFL